MSQEKVDAHKAEKQNRAEVIRKEKRRRVIVRTIWIIIAAAIVVWIVFSARHFYRERRTVTPISVNMTAINTFFDEE